MSKFPPRGKVRLTADIHCQTDCGKCADCLHDIPLAKAGDIFTVSIGQDGGPCIDIERDEMRIPVLRSEVELVEECEVIQGKFSWRDAA